MRKWFISLNGLSFRNEFRCDRLKMGRGLPFAFRRMNMWERNPDFALVGIIMPFFSMSATTKDMFSDREVMSGGGMLS